MKKRIKNIYFLMIAVVSFCLCIKTFNAGFTCEYTNNGQSSGYTDRVTVTVNNNYTGPYSSSKWNSKVNYETWNGEQIANVQSQSAESNLISDFYDLWISKNRKCPKYLVAKFEEQNRTIVNRPWGIVYEVLFYTTKTTYTGYKTLTVVNEKPTGITTVESAKAFVDDTYSSERILYYIHNDGSKINSNTAYNVSNYEDSFTIEQDKSIVVYGKPLDPYLGFSIKESLNFRDKIIECKSENSNLVNVEKYDYIPFSDGQNSSLYSPGIYVVLKGVMPTNGHPNNSIEIKCNIYENNRKKFITDAIFFVTVTPSTTPIKEDEVKVKDISCQYDLNYKKANDIYKFANAKVEVTGYNDGKNSSATVLSYVLNTKNGSDEWANVPKTVTVKNYKRTGTDPFDTKNDYGIKFNIDNYIQKVSDVGADCPELYVKRSGSTYVVLTEPCSDCVSTFTTVTLKTGKEGGKETFTEDETKTMFFEYAFYDNNDNREKKENPLHTGLIVLYRSGKGLGIYQRESFNIDVKKNQMTIADLNNSFDYTTNTGGQDVIYSYTNYIRLDSSFLKAVRKALDEDKKTIGEYYNKNIIEDGSKASLANEIYVLSMKEIENYTKEGINDSGSSTSTEVGTGTYKNDGSSSWQGGSTSQLEIKDFDNNSDYTTDQWCSEIFKGDVKDIVKTLILGIRIAVPVLMILFSMIDFMKAVSDSEKMPTAKKNAITRLIIGFAVFLLPSILKVIFTIADLPSCSDIF